MIVLTKCLSYQEKYCADDDTHYEDYQLTDLMNATFGLAPRGYGISSYRVLELMSMNVIPVILQVSVCVHVCVFVVGERWWAGRLWCSLISPPALLFTYTHFDTHTCKQTGRQLIAFRRMA